jgi:hypothetical protein
MRDGGVLPVSTPSIPLPRLKREAEGLLTHPLHPLPRLKCETEGCYLRRHPPLLETQDGGVLCRHTPFTSSLARNARRRGVTFIDTLHSPPLLVTLRVPVETRTLTREKPIPLVGGMDFHRYGYGYRLRYPGVTCGTPYPLFLTATVQGGVSLVPLL